MDSLPIEPESITVANNTFTFDENTNSIFISSQAADSINVCYRTISSKLITPFVNRKIQDYDASRKKIKLSPTTQPTSSLKKEELFQTKNIEKYGSLSRGISFGNTQNLSVHSNLNLQLAGKLTEKLFVEASITDQNTPYQPEGNTRQIRDFDNVFIRLYTNDFSLKVGDILLQNMPNSYFLKYKKSIQGLLSSVKLQKKDWSLESRVSVASGKGKFTSATVKPIEGVSGPYKLVGQSGERFIVIQPNTEKIFLDGRLLQRGFDNDYVIDYNLGEITFNNHILITQFSVIRADYEYKEQTYNRSNFSFFQSAKKNNITLYSNYYLESDNPNSNQSIQLDAPSKLHVQQIGDQTNEAFVTTIDTSNVAVSSFKYSLKDTVNDGTSYTVYIYSPTANQNVYSPSFTEVGVNQGNYKLLSTTTNGKVFEWLPPQNGIPQGNYKAGRLIALPTRKQVFNIGGKIQINPYDELSFEVATSGLDKNLFSNIDDNDNIGWATHLLYTSKGKPSFFDNYKWKYLFEVEMDGNNFAPIDRYQPINFDRDWSFERPYNSSSKDFIAHGDVALYKNDKNQLTLSFNRRNRTNEIDGWQNKIVFNQQLKGIQLASSMSISQSSQQNTNTLWNKFFSDIQYNKLPVVVGYTFKSEDNTFKREDSVTHSLMNYASHSFYVHSQASQKTNYEFRFTERQDKQPFEGEMKDYLNSQNLIASLKSKGKHQELALNLNYRKTKDLLQITRDKEEIILGQMTWKSDFLKNSLRQNFIFSTNNARELKQEFQYLPVNNGEGTHTWRDIDEDNIQDLNEFFLALNSDERNYVKFFVPTDDYVTSFHTRYIHVINWAAPKAWITKSSFKKTISKFSATINLKVNFKTTASDIASRLNPFVNTWKDANFITTRDRKLFTLYFNRNKGKLSYDISYLTNDTKWLNTQGFELKEKKEWVANFIVNLSPSYSLRLIGKIGNEINTSDFLQDRNFHLLTNQLTPRIIWLPAKNIRIITSIEWLKKTNTLFPESNETVINTKYNIEGVWSRVKKGTLRFTFSLIKNELQGIENSYLGYILLDGLATGSNQIWQVNWQQKISKGMQCNMIYDGRKSQGRKAIHSGKFQVTAFF